ncbi:unnamed protein product [Amoebophrya sp. A120]|nr:unnamed protein product [Amoebophrya sp. A120]|eukprot:GSA120T00012276001.1
MGGAWTRDGDYMCLKKNSSVWNTIVKKAIEKNEKFKAHAKDVEFTEIHLTANQSAMKSTGTSEFGLHFTGTFSWAQQIGKTSKHRLEKMHCHYQADKMLHNQTGRPADPNHGNNIIVYSPLHSGAKLTANQWQFHTDLYHSNNDKAQFHREILQQARIHFYHAAKQAYLGSSARFQPNYGPDGRNPGSNDVVGFSPNSTIAKDAALLLSSTPENYLTRAKGAIHYLISKTPQAQNITCPCGKFWQAIQIDREKDRQNK